MQGRAIYSGFPSSSDLVHTGQIKKTKRNAYKSVKSYTIVRSAEVRKSIDASTSQ